MPAAFANASSWWMGLKSPDAPAYRVSWICWMGSFTRAGISRPTSTSSKYTVAYFTTPASEPDDDDVAHHGHDVILPVGDDGLPHDEGHGPRAPGLLVDVHDPGAAEVGLPRADRLPLLELLLAVQDARDVGAEIAEERARVLALVPEGDGEGGRRDDVAPFGGTADLVVEVER